MQYRHELIVIEGRPRAVDVTLESTSLAERLVQRAAQITNEEKAYILRKLAHEASFNSVMLEVRMRKQNTDTSLRDETASQRIETEGHDHSSESDDVHYETAEELEEEGSVY